MTAVKGLFLPKRSPWRHDLERQLLQFPAGKYDDAVDVCSLFGRGLEYVVPARKPRREVVDEPSGGWMG